MEKIINGKRYNTETATRIGDKSYGYAGDFNHYSDTLYRKRTGEFFLYGEGGPMSKYAEHPSYNETTGGEVIKPLTYEEAREWSEENLEAEKYESIFGKVDEGSSDEKQTVALRLSLGAIQTLKNKAAQEQCSLSECVERMILK